MKFIKKQVIPSVKMFEVYESFIAYSQTYYDLFLNGTLIMEQCGGYYFHNRCLYYFVDDKTMIRSLQNGTLSEKPVILQLEDLPFKTYLAAHDSLLESDNYYSAQLALYQLEPFQKLHDLPGRYKYEFPYRKDESIYFVVADNRTLVKALDIRTGAFLWSTKVGGGYFRHPSEQVLIQINQFICIYEKQLILTTNNDEFVSLHTETGAILWQTKDFVKTYFSDARNWIGLGDFELRDGKLYHLIGNSYYSFDLKTQQVTILWEDLVHDGYLKVTHRFYTPDFIYFTAAKNMALEPIFVGVFNRKTLHVDWIERVKGQKYGLNRGIRATGDQLYVLDGAENLHVFEQVPPTVKRTRSKKG
jgi:outer membrane protein assembly factor BamB